MAREEVEVAFKIEMETRKLEQRMGAFDKEIRKTSRSVTELGAIGKSMGKSYFVEMKKSQQSILKFQKVARTSTQQILKARKAMATATTATEKKQIQQRIKLYIQEKQTAIKAARDAMKEQKKLLEKAVGKVGLGDLAKQMETDWPKFMQKAMKKTEFSEFTKSLATEAKDALQEGFDSFKGKDIGGMIKGGGKLASSLLKGAGGYGGAALTKGGAKMQAKGADMGGAAGTALKAVGGVMSKMGPMLGMLAKMGPLLSTSAAIFAGMVKVMIDAEAQAKGMNKEILETSSTAETLYKHGHDVGGAFKDISHTLDAMRSDATDFSENIKYGMKSEDIIAATKGFTQAGVSLESLKTSFQHAGGAAEESASQVQDFGDMARMSFGYSKLLGVSLSEITELQSEMFTEMGSSLSGINLQFANMAKDAVESGIASNKFFNIIRGISSDLALYTTRMGQASTMLKLLGKSMNPREAQKFMQVAVQGLKQMGEEDRLRLTLLAGEGKMRDIVGKDLDRKSKLMAADLKNNLGNATEFSVEEIQNLLKKAQAGSADAGKKLQGVFDKLPDNMKGSMKSALSEMKMDTNALKKGGLVGLSEAAANLSAAGALTATKAALQRFGGGGKLKDMTGIQALAARKAANVSLEQFRQMAKLEDAVDEQKDEMVAALENPTPTAEQAELIARMKALGITSKEQVKAADDADVIAAMEKNQQDALAAAAEQKNWQEETAKLTSSLTDKVEAIIEALFEFIYVALADIIKDLNEFIELVAWKFDKDRPEKVSKRMDQQLKATKTKENKDLVDAMLRAGAGESDPYKKKAAMIGVLGPAMQKGLEQGMAQDKEAKRAADQTKKEKELGRTLTGKELEDFNKEFEANFSKKSLQQQMGPKFVDDFSDVFVRGFKKDNGQLDVGRVKEVASMDASMDQAKVAKFKSLMDVKDENTGEAKYSVLGAAQEAGFSAEDMKKLYMKSVWGMKPEELANTAGYLDTAATAAKPVKVAITQPGDGGSAAGPAAGAPAAGKPAAGAPAPGAPPPVTTTGQTAATNKSAAPGTGAPTVGAGGAVPPPKPPPPGPPPPAAIPKKFPSTEGDEAILDALDSGLFAISDVLEDIFNALRKKGVKLDKNHTLDEIQKGTLESIRKGLFEYALYTSEDPEKLLDKMDKSGFAEVGKMATAFKDEKNYKEGFLTETLGGNATGALVTGVSGGLAKLSAAPGEGLASIGPGERILPAGGGGGGAGGITLNVNGIGGTDLANYLKEKMATAIYEYKKREKLT